MKIRFYNARILTMIEGSSMIEGELWIDKNKIIYVGEPKETELQWDREIDVQKNVLMPGFKDAHTHSAMTFLRSYADDLPLLEWLEKQVFPMEAKLTGEDIYHLSKLAIMEYLTSGITANFDMYFHPEEIAKASIDCGFRTVMVGAVSGDVSSLKGLEEDFITYNQYHELISYCLGFHAQYTSSEELLKGVAKLAQNYQAPVFTHNSESVKEVQQCIEQTGKTPTAYMDSLGVFDYGGGAYHCVHMTDEDLQIFKDRKLAVVTNSGSNVKLASGIARIQDMLDRGIEIAIGTDGAASNNCLDMFREMFLVTGLAKIAGKDASAVSADKVLHMATVGGAKAMGLKECDTLEAGKLADLVIIDLHQPNMQPLNNIVKNIVYSGSKLNVKLTMVNGQILYEDGVFSIGVEPEEVYEHANRIIARMKGES